MLEKDFINFLSKLRKNELPGITSHLKMIPYKTNPEIRKFEPNPDSKRSSVLILFLENKELNEFNITFTLRSSKLRKHSGQISFPGGKKDKGETNIETALRESNEEIGLNKNDVEIINELSELFVPPSNSIVSPIVAYSDKNLKLTPNEDEVEEIIFKDFKHFHNKENIKFTHNLYPNQITEFPYWDINHRVPLWGATAIILQEIIDLWDIFNQNVD